MPLLERLFSLRARGTTPLTEVRAGLVTFLTMAYVLVVNPQILSHAGMPAADVTAATALSAAAATLLMGLWANYPFALAPGMGLNAYFTYGVVLGMGLAWQTALAAVFVAGLVFLLLSFGGVRTAILRAIPESIKHAIAPGIGLFIALIGLRNAGLVVASPATLVQLGDVRQGPVLLALGGLLLTAALTARRVKGALLLGIAATTAVAWASGLAPAPRALLAAPALPRTTLLALDLSQVWSGPFLSVTLAFLFVAVFDTAGTLLGVGRAAGFLTPAGELPRADRAFAADALGSVAGALAGTSTVTCYVESAAGVEEGGRTGLTAVVVAGLFALSLLFVPLLSAIPSVATAPALVVVGAMMLGHGAAGLKGRMDEVLPAFLTIALMPFTYSIAHGIGAGLVSYAALKLLTGRPREAHPLLYALAALLALHYALG
jgi:AGZA family xanthine/uracil permease-like MFS transporter